MKDYKRLTSFDEKEGLILDNCKNCTFCDMCYSCESALIRLAELEDKIENGTLIELPCKVGTTLYFTVTVGQENIDGFKYGILESNKWLYVIDKNGEITIEENYYFFKFEYTYDYTFGENVFLTKAEAEAKLKELKGEV